MSPGRMNWCLIRAIASSVAARKQAGNSSRIARHRLDPNRVIDRLLTCIGAAGWQLRRALPSL
jgi:hypothetical protein